MADNSSSVARDKVANVAVHPAPNSGNTSNDRPKLAASAEKPEDKEKVVNAANHPEPNTRNTRNDLTVNFAPILSAVIPPSPTPSLPGSTTSGHSAPDHSVVNMDSAEKPLIETNADKNGRKSTLIRKPETDSGNRRSILPRPISQMVTNTVQLSYSAKKSVAQGMMDIALLTANASQLRYVLRHKDAPYQKFSVGLISLSLILQICAGIAMIYLGHYDSKKKEQQHSPKMRRINNSIVIFIFLITVINVMIAAFGTESGEKASAPPITLPTH